MDTPQNKNTEQFKITGDWNIQSKQLKAAYQELTDSDVKFEPGKEIDLLTRLETRLGKNRQEVIDILQKTLPATV